MLTPDYASPEQVRGERITTATDVYALGAILYELLTGLKPHRLEQYTPSEIEHSICAIEPAPPSTVVSDSATRRQLADDLDKIVLMALRKEPERRYHSVEQFSEDIRRHLEGLPVSARPDTLAYRLGKFVRRRRWVVASAAVAILALIGGSMAIAYQAHRAEQRFQQARKLANVFLFEYHDKIKNLAGATPARELVVRTGLEYLRSLEGDAGGDPTLALEIARGYNQLCDIQSRMENSDVKTALATNSKGAQLLETLARKRPQDSQVLLSLIEAHHARGYLLSLHGEAQSAIDVFRREQEAAGQALAIDPENLAAYDHRVGASLMIAQMLNSASYRKPAKKPARRWMGTGIW